jgi:hypothetical protein
MSAKAVGIWERGRRALGMTQDYPPVPLDVGFMLSVGAFRIATALLAVSATAAVAQDPVFWVGGILAVILLLFLPRPVWPPVIVLMFGVGLAAGPVDPIRTAIVLLTAHLLMVLCTLLGRMPWGSRVELRVLRRPLARFGIIQILAQGLALLGYWLTVGGVTMGILTMIVAILMAVAAWVLSWRLRLARDEEMPGDPTS